MKTLFRQLGQWFFAAGDARTAAAIRMAFAGLYLFVLWDFYPVLHLLFGADGLNPPLPVAGVNPYSPLYLLLNHPTPLVLESWFWVSVAVSSAALVGFLTRVSVVLMFLSFLIFQTRGDFILFGADLFMRCCALWLLFLPSGKAWSVDSWLRARRGVRASVEIDAWPIKAIQFQTALVYLVTCLVKLSTRPWQDGSAVYYALQVGDVMYGQAFAFLAPYRFVFPLMTYATLLFEGLFFFMVFYRPLRNVALIGGVAFHLGIDVMMSIRFFSLSMFMGYLAFVGTDGWDWLASWARRVRARLALRDQSPARVVFDGDCGLCQSLADRFEVPLRLVGVTCVTSQSLSSRELEELGLFRTDVARRLYLASASGKVRGGAHAINALAWRLEPRLRPVVALLYLVPVLFVLECLAYRAVARHRASLSRALGLQACRIGGRKTRQA